MDTPTLNPRRPTVLPPPSRQHATCAWCGSRFDGIVDLLSHVDATHVPHAA